MLFRLSLLLLCLVVCRSSNGEIILLKNGGELLGMVSDKQSSDTLLKIRTISGGLLIIPRNQIAQIVPRNRRERAYYTQRDKTPDTIEGHLELALWCSDKDLRQYRRAHLIQIIRKNPDHRKARILLGYARYQGQWLTREQRMRARGYQRYRGRWRLPQSIAIHQQREQNKWYQPIQTWVRAIKGPDTRQARIALGKIRKLSDPDSLPALHRFLSKDPAIQIRILYIETLFQIHTPLAIDLMVTQSLLDDSMQIHSIVTSHFAIHRDPDPVTLYTENLTHENTRVVQRSADALSKIGDAQSVAALIRVLVDSPSLSEVSESTIEQPPSKRERSATPSLDPLISNHDGTDANHSPKAPLSGVVDEVPVTGNPEILAALETLTGENFHYDQKLWFQWWNNIKDQEGHIKMHREADALK